MPPRTPPDKALAVLDAASMPGSDATRKQIGAAVGVSHDTVTRLLARYGPVAESLRTLKRDHFLGAWQWLFLDTLRELSERSEDGTLTLRDRKDAAITLGIATEKALLLAGQPTQIVAGIHEHRVSLPELASRMAAVAKRVGQSATAHQGPPPSP